MNVLVVSSWFPSKINATNGNFIERHIKALLSLEHLVIVIHEGFSNRILFPQLCEENREGMHIIHLLQPRWMKGFKFIRRLQKQRCLKVLGRLNLDFDIVHGHIMHPVGYLAEDFATTLKVPLVFTEQWSGLLPSNPKRLHAKVLESLRKTALRCQFILPVSESLKTAMINLDIQSDYRVIYNTVDTKLFQRNKSKRFDRFTFLHVSNFAEVKNTEGIIEAFSIFQNRNPNLMADLLIVGDGDIEKLKKYQEQKAPNLTHIRFMSTQPYSRIAELMQSSHCFILFSDYETFGCVVAESHCTGLPVIATKVGAVPELVNDSNGLLIEPRNLEQLSVAMAMIIETYADYDTAHIEREAAKRFSYKAIALDFEKAYSDAILDF